MTIPTGTPIPIAILSDVSKPPEDTIPVLLGVIVPVDERSFELCEVVVGSTSVVLVGEGVVELDVWEKEQNNQQKAQGHEISSRPYELRDFCLSSNLDTERIIGPDKSQIRHNRGDGSIYIHSRHTRWR